MAWMLPVRAAVPASARTLVFYPQVISKRTLQCVQVTDASAAIVRSSVRPSENVRVTTMCIVASVTLCSLVLFLIHLGLTSVIHSQDLDLVLNLYINGVL
jgi:hypothetical protein